MYNVLFMTVYSAACCEYIITSSSLYQLDIVGGEESIGAVQLSDAPPPTLVNLLYVGNDLIGIKRDLSIVS